MADEKELKFEEAMEKLEKIVYELEEGDVPLEKAIDLFQQGMQLSKWCGQKLEQIEQKINMLIEEDGNWVQKPFDQTVDVQEEAD